MASYFHEGPVKKDGGDGGDRDDDRKDDGRDRRGEKGHGEGLGPAYQQEVPGLGTLTWNTAWNAWVDARGVTWQTNVHGWWFYWDGGQWVNPHAAVAQVVAPQATTPQGASGAQPQQVPILTAKQQDAATVRNAASGGGVWTMARVDADGAELGSTALRRAGPVERGDFSGQERSSRDAEVQTLRDLQTVFLDRREQLTGTVTVVLSGSQGPCGDCKNRMTEFTQWVMSNARRLQFRFTLVIVANYTTVYQGRGDYGYADAVQEQFVVERHQISRWEREHSRTDIS